MFDFNSRNLHEMWNLAANSHFLFGILNYFFKLTRDEGVMPKKSDCFFYILFFLGGCRRVKFLPPESGQYLEGHVFLNLTIGINTPCEDRCVMESECVSVNIGPPLNGRVVCELSNSDHFKHPEDIKQRPGWIYRGTEVQTVDRT